MKFAHWTLPALSLLAGVQHASAKAILSPGLLRERRDLAADLESSNLYAHDSELERRSPQATTEPAVSETSQTESSNGSLELDTGSSQENLTIAESCQRALSGKTTTVNAAGFTGCYNVLNWNPVTTEFESDLRIYTSNTPSDQFVGISKDMILVLLNFPSSTVFKSLTKRSTSDLTGRQDSNATQQVQQYSLTGRFASPLDLAKLSETQMASLLTPQISMQATSATGQTFSTPMTSVDMALFTTGQFTALASSAPEITDPNTAATAIKTSTIFVLPGQTFGIFPVGLIVTSAWTVLFFLTYGLGTIARFRYRSIYRKRVAAMSTRQWNGAASRI